ncbi:MAG: hypothetical protein OXG51_04990, partial [Gammaproteobacteria bacterium]|nr:hypothetical protein [Gammaproteobacteria bacterium]
AIVLRAALYLIHNWGGRLVLVYMAEPARYCDVVESWRRECRQYRQYLPKVGNERDQVIDTFERLGVPVVDGHTVFLETGRLEDMFFHPFSHNSPEGSRVIADALLSEIRPMLDHRPGQPPVTAAPAARNDS